MVNRKGDQCLLALVHKGCFRQDNSDFLRKHIRYGQRDVRGMYDLLTMLCYSDFLSGNFQIETAVLSSTDQIYYCDIFAIVQKEIVEQFFCRIFII